MKKSVLAAALAIALVASGCNKKEESGSGSVTDGEEQSNYGAIEHGPDENKVGFSMTGEDVVEAEGVPEEEKEKIMEAFKQYIETLNNQDVDGYLATLSPEGYDLEEERKVTEDLFKEYDLKREASNETIVKYEENEAQLFSTLTTTFKQLSTGDETAPEGRQVTVFHKEDGEWKVFSVHFIGENEEQ